MIQRTLLLLITALLIGCATKISQKVDFNPSEPLRVVVLPFVQMNEDNGELAIDEISLVSEKLGENPAPFVQKVTLQEIGKTSLDVIPQYLVSAKLVHEGFRSTDLRVDAFRASKLTPQEVCQHLFTCDAVLVGKVTKWDRSYYGLQSVATVGIELTLLSGRDGKILFQSRAEDSESRGITKIPTGFSDLVLEPIKGLDNEIISDLARRLVSKMLSPLVASSRPEFLATMAPAIYASAHDSSDGMVSLAHPLTVLLYGSAKQAAFFSIGTAIENIPLVEHEPGHYIGHFYPLPSDSFAAQPVTVSLIDEFGRNTSQQVGKILVRAENK